MAKELVSPYVAHVFVCTNDRKGERQSCADNNSQALKDRLKEAVHEKGWKLEFWFPYKTTYELSFRNFPGGFP